MMSILKAVAVLMLSLCVCCSLALASDQDRQKEHVSTWQKIKNRHGVIVYSHEVNDSDIIKVKAEVLINAGMEKVKSVLDDVANRKDWVPYLVESRVLKKYSDNEKLEYSLFDAPSPASDRDFVYYRQLLHKDATKIVFTMNVRESELMPEQDGVVRADLIESKYTLTALSNKQTKVELIFHADPKGLIPDWIVNIVQRVLPFRMLRNLKMVVEKRGLFK